MNSLPTSFDGRALRVAEERRVSIAIGASILIHALTIAGLRGLTPAIYASPQLGVGSRSALQAVIAPPRSLPEPTPPTETEVLVAPRPLARAAQPLEPPRERPPPATGSLAGGNPVRTGPNASEVSI